MRIGLDAMGTDGAPGIEVAGAIGALEQDQEINVVLVGDRDQLAAAIESAGGMPDRLEIRHAPDRVRPGDASASVVRKKPESSIVVGVRMLQAGEVDGFVSGGSTGAVMATSVIVLRSLEGVDRPTIGTVLPTAKGPMVLLDAGANVDCRPLHLVQFAHMGAIYAQDLLGVASPRVGLLNIGEEPEKGNELALESFRLLSEDSRLDFVGNIEGSAIIRGGCDVLVADGFVGNILLKTYESAAAFIVESVREVLAGVEVPESLAEIFRRFDYSEHGGAPLLGVNGVAVICHGGSSPKAIQNGIRVAARAVTKGMVRHMAGELADLKRSRESA